MVKSVKNKQSIMAYDCEPILGKLKQEDSYEANASLSYRSSRPSLKKKNQ